MKISDRVSSVLSYAAWLSLSTPNNNIFLSADVNVGKQYKIIEQGVEYVQSNGGD